jgi:hypothetical protein
MKWRPFSLCRIPDRSQRVAAFEADPRRFALDPGLAERSMRLAMARVIPQV